jgi:hypothetical protein
VLNAGVHYIRLVSDSGNITGINFSGVSATGQPYGFFGTLGQVWTAPDADGNYTQSTPGFRTESNFQSSPFNFDSHFLGNESNYIVDAALGEGNILFPNGNTIPSDNSTGYGFGRRYVQPAPGFLTGSYHVMPGAESPTLDLAYIVAGYGDVLYRGEVITNGGTFGLVGILGGPIPEPAGLSILLLATSVSLSARRRR